MPFADASKSADLMPKPVRCFVDPHSFDDLDHGKSFLPIVIRMAQPVRQPNAKLPRVELLQALFVNFRQRKRRNWVQLRQAGLSLRNAETVR
jgi:hypothetical protein